MCFSTQAQIVHFNTSSYNKSNKLNKVASNIQILDLELDNLKLLKSKEGGLNFNLQINNEKSWDLELESTEILSPVSQIRLLSENAELKVPEANISTYRGHLKNRSNSSVALTHSDGYLAVMIKDDLGSYIIEPLSLYDNKAFKNQFVFYNIEDIHPENKFACKKTDILTDIKSNVGLVKSNTMACLEIELAIVVDYLMYVSEGSDVNNILNTLTNLYNLVNLDFESGFNHELNFKIKEIVISICPACDQWSDTNNVGDALSSIKDWGESGGFNETYDLGIFWTTRIFNDNFGGLAYLDQICGDQRYITVRKYTANSQSLRIMMSHEIGHSFGCVHNYDIGSACESNPGRASMIMDPTVDPASVGWTDGTMSCDLNSTATINAKIGSVNCLGACATLSCDAITDLNVTNVLLGGMNLNWSGSANNYQVRIKEDGATSYIYDVNTATNSISVNMPLEYCKQYHVSVKALCANGSEATAVTEIVEITGGTAMQILYVEPKNCDAGAYELEVVLAYENTVPGGFNVIANGVSQVFSYTSSPQTINMVGLNTANNNNAILEAYGVTNSSPDCYGITSYTEPDANCQIVISEFFNECELPHNWSATSSSTSLFSENYEWKFNDGDRTILNYGASNNAPTHKTINGTCAAYFDDDIFLNPSYTGTISLESRPYDLTNMSDVEIEVVYNFHNFTDGKANNASEFSIDVFDGSGWINLMFDNDDSCPWSNVWNTSCMTNFKLDVTNYISNQFKVRFNYTDGNNGDWTGMIMLDDFKVSGIQLPVLDLKIVDFKGELVADEVDLEWDIKKDKSFSHYVLKHSANGVSFKAMAELEDASQYVDYQPVVGSNYYKLYMYDLDGNFVESNTIKIDYHPAQSIKLYPNPTNTNQVSLVNTSSIEYDQLKIFDIRGRQIDSEKINGRLNLDLDISDYRKGVYLIQLSNSTAAKTLRLVRL